MIGRAPSPGLPWSEGEEEGEGVARAERTCQEEPGTEVVQGQWWATRVPLLGTQVCHLGAV